MFALSLVLGVPQIFAQGNQGNGEGHGQFNDGHNRRVPLISIDGMHALDYENCAASGACPTLKALGTTGVNYLRTSTSRPSDSFPGLMALVTGGTPKTVGAYYDVAYDRVLAGPSNPAGTWNGLNGGGPCMLNTPNGTRTEYEEGVDIDPSQLGSGYSGYRGFDGGYLFIDSTRLPRDPYKNCQPDSALCSKEWQFYFALGLSSAFRSPRAY